MNPRGNFYSPAGVRGSLLIYVQARWAWELGASFAFSIGPCSGSGFCRFDRGALEQSIPRSTGATKEDAMKSKKYETCVEACHQCMAACEHCATSCLQEPDVQDMIRCITLDRSCGD